MYSKKMLMSTVSVLGLVFVLFLCIGLPDANAEDEPGLCEGLPTFGCPDDCEFTQDFRLEDCKFKTRGINPFFILKPGYQVVLESEDEKSVETVLCDAKSIHIDGRRIKTRVVEERAFEDDKLVEISRNYFAICKRPTRFTTLGNCPVTARKALMKTINVKVERVKMVHG